MLAILALAQTGAFSLLNSEALEYEARRIPDETRRNEVMAMLSLASERLELTDEAEALAESLESHGVRPMDAVHLALASIAKADFFASCDDQLVKKGQAISGLTCEVVPVLGLLPEVIK